MVSRKSIPVFDTSVINRLTAEADFPALAAGLTTAYSTRLTGSNVAELVATTKSEKREQLLDTCQRLLASPVPSDTSRGCASTTTAVTPKAGVE